MNRQTVFTAALLVLIPVVAIAQPAGDSVEASDSKKIADQVILLVAQLDADQYSVRQQAHRSLLKLAEQSLPALIEATQSKSTEQRYRALELIRTIQHRTLADGFRRLAALPDEQIDLEHGMWLISRIVDSRADRQQISKQLDAMADAVKRKLAERTAPNDGPPAETVAVLIHVLKDEFGLAGNDADYNNPHNDSLAKVLETRRGLPILLSHVAVAVADRLELPVVGIPVPGRYMIKYDGGRAPKQHPSEDILVDPYRGWQIKTPEQIIEEIPSLEPNRDLQASPRRASLTRMMVNLAAHFTYAGDDTKAEQVRHYIAILESYESQLSPP